MVRREFCAEQIVFRLKRIEVLMAQGKPVALACIQARVMDFKAQHRLYSWLNFMQN